MGFASKFLGRLRAKHSAAEDEVAQDLDIYPDVQVDADQDTAPNDVTDISGEVAASGGATDDEPALDVTSADDAEDSAEEAPGEKDDDLFASIFAKETEEELSPVDLLIASTPDVSLGELLEEAEELKSVIARWYES